MRILVPALLASTLAACATAPRQPVTPVPTTRPQPQPVQRGDLIGHTVNELAARFGAPHFQVREGPGLKLQWSGPACVLDAFLYPAPGTTVMRVTFVDARRTSGDPVDRAGCIAALDAAG